MSTTNVTIRIDADLKKQSEELFKDFGLSLSSAFTMFLKQSVREQRIPFIVQKALPNEATLQAIAEVDAMEQDRDNYKSFKSIDEFMEDLNS